MSPVTALVLAAGHSQRMGGESKLLREIEGVPVVARAVDALLAAGLAPVRVVTGHDAGGVRGALAGRAVRFVHNPRHAEGMGASLRAGAEAVAPDVAGVLVCLGDLPWLRPASVRALLDAFEAAGDDAICVPVHAGQQGHPVLFASRYLPELRELGGDQGARPLLERHAGAVVPVPVDDPGVLRDVDLPADFEEPGLFGGG